MTQIAAAQIFQRFPQRNINNAAGRRASGAHEMPHRRVADEDGRWWDVWDTRPTIIDRRAGRERRTGRRIAGDRRQKSEPRVTVEPEFRKGWLAFQSGTDWRRFAPIPDHWESLPDKDLLALLARAGATEPQRA